MALDDTMSHDSEQEEEDQKDPIKSMVVDCNDLFRSGLARSADTDRSLPAMVLRFLNDYQRRFEGWCAYLSVFALRERASLDYRLRDHPSLQDMIMRLLDILRDNLLMVTDHEPLCNASSSPQEVTELPSGFQVGFTGIKESIHRLNKLGVTIRGSSRSTLVARARRFAAQ